LRTERITLFRIIRSLSIVVLFAYGLQSCRSTVDADPLARIELLPGSPMTMGVGETSNILASLFRADELGISDRGVVWESSHPSVATVTATEPRFAILTAVAPGKTTITATAGDKTASVDVTVIVRPPSVPKHAFLWTPESGMIDLGVLPGQTQSMAEAMSDSGEVVGSSGDSLLMNNAFIWSPTGGMTAIDPFPGASFTFATDINNAGQVSGYAFVGGLARGFVWSRVDGMRDLGRLPGATNARAWAINDSGVVVGDSDGRPFRWTFAGGLEELGIPPTGTGARALDINQSGHMVGASGTGYDPAQRAVLWNPDGQILEVTCCTADARGINRYGEIVGTFNALRPFVWTPSGGRTELPLPAGMSHGTADAINDIGQVAGWVHGQPGDRAVVWTRPSAPRDLGSLPGRERCFGNDINNRGQVVGYCD
jgi:uncharacterized membrane protein